MIPYTFLDKHHNHPVCCGHTVAGNMILGWLGDQGFHRKDIETELIQYRDIEQIRGLGLRLVELILYW